MYQIRNIIILLIILTSCKPDSEKATAEEIYLQDYESSKIKWGYIDKSGSIVIDAIYDDTRDFNNGLAAASLAGKWGFIDKKGKSVVPFKYLDVSNFSEGLALVKSFEGNYLYIDEEGKKIMECPYAECFPIKDGFARVLNNGIINYMLLDGTLTNIKGSDGTDFVSGLASLQYGHMHKVIQKDGTFLFDDDYDDISIYEAYIVGMNAGKYKIYDRALKKWHPNSFDYMGPIVDNYTTVDLDGSGYIYDCKNQKLWPLPGTNPRHLGEYRFTCQVDDKWIITNNEGVPVGTASYDNIFMYHCGICAVQQGDGWGYIDLFGSWIVKPTLPIVWDCSEDYVRFISTYGYGFLDKNGIVKIAPKYYEARDFKEGLARVQPIPNFN